MPVPITNIELPKTKMRYVNIIATTTKKNSDEEPFGYPYSEDESAPNAEIEEK